MPNLFAVGGYKIYFWSDERNEPIHVHVSKGHPTDHSTKIWLTKSGGCIVANNASHIPQHELNQLMEFIEAQFFYICFEWKRFFVLNEIRYYC